MLMQVCGVVTRFVGIGVGAAGVLGGVGCVSAPEPVSNEDAWRVEANGLAVEYLPRADRYTYFGPEKGPNLMYAVGLDRLPPADGSYTFYGGCYTWVAPQHGPAGWAGYGGEPLPWPPDPAMDVGPGYRSGRSLPSATVTTPRQRSGVREVKRFELMGPDAAELWCTLVNAGDVTVERGAWVITACPPDGAIAVRAPAGTPLRGWDDVSVDRLLSVLSEPDEHGWRVLDLEDVDWEGGVKVYIDGPAELAVWREGWWLHRRQLAEDVDSLLAHGEGPVALYLQPSDSGPPIFEAELYGPIVAIEPGGEHTSVETWRLVESPKPKTEALGQ